MDSLFTAAARALAAGDLPGALKPVALRSGCAISAGQCRACHQLSQMTLATSWTAARKFRAVFS
jgi:hypothetical protein